MNPQIQKVVADFQKLKEVFWTRKGTADNLKQTLGKLEASKAEKIHQALVFDQARLLLAESSRYAKEQVKVQLEKLVTSGLQYIFGEDIRFEIDITEGARTEAEFYVVSMTENGEVRTRPELARGGGVVDIVCLVLRIAVLQATSPTIDGPIILDEPVKMVSMEYIEKVGEFLKQLHQYFGRQVIMATHSAYLAEMADQKYRVTQINGVSQIEQITA